METIDTRPAGAVGVETLDPGVFPYDAWELDYTDPANPVLRLAAPWRLSVTPYAPVPAEPSLGSSHQNPRDNTNRQVYSAGVPGAGFWSAAITDSFAPGGATQMHACVQLQLTVTALGVCEGRLFFSDNNTTTPVLNQTSHPEVDVRAYANTGVVLAQTFDIWIPLNSSGQFYIYRDGSTLNLTSFVVVIKSLGYNI